MPVYSIETIQVIIKGTWLQQAGPADITYLLVDSRKTGFPGQSLFFALKGPRRDGHAFVGEAAAAGIKNFIVSDKDTVLPEGANVILVKDTLQALQLLAASHRRQFSYPVIGITGSNGKTVVKEWLYQLLQEKYDIVRSPKSYNSQLGVPLSVWQMDQKNTLALIEAGISRSGEMDKLEKIIQPTIGIFTNIGEAHAEGFLNQRQKVKEKLQLFTRARCLVYCSDYPEINEGIASLVQQLRNKPGDDLQLFSWSTHTDANLRIISLLKDETVTYIAATYKGEELSFKIPFTDQASVENALNCFCTLLVLDLPFTHISAGIMELKPLAMRLELKKGINRCTVINDAYSADTDSLRIALDFMARQQQQLRRTVILSDIPESGKSDNELCRQVAHMLSEKKVTRLIGIGPQLTRHRKIFEAGAVPETIFFETTEAFVRNFYTLNFYQETILLKGARVFAFEQLLPLLEEKKHQTVLEINLTSVLHNLQQYQQQLRPSTRIMAMVKAASYGSGASEIAGLLQFHKVDYLAVAYADEGIQLRNNGITLPIMVMNPETNAFGAMLQFSLEPDIYSFDLFDKFNAFLAREEVSQYPVHLELETGLNRLGIPTGDMALLADKLQAGHCRVQSVFTHLAVSEDPAGDSFTRQQANTYRDAVDFLQSRVSYPFIRHIANSAAIIRYPALQLDMVRLGIGLYGVDSAASGMLDLKEISTLKTTVAQVKQLLPGDTVGYGRQGRAGEATTIATVRLGYSDGYPRRLGNGRGQMIVNGRRVPVIGTVSMDMTMLDVTGAGPVEEGDEVIVFGRDLSIREIAAWAGTIPYEIMTGISERVNRLYFEE